MAKGARGIIKKIVSTSSVAVGALPAVVPAVKAGQGLASGANIEGAINAGLAPIGISTAGTVDWAKLSKYGIFTAACWGAMVGMRYLGKKL